MSKKKRLNAIVAIERDVKTRAYKDLSKEHALLQKPALAMGMQRTYAPKDDDGERFPPESVNVQVRVKDALVEVHERMRELFDITLTKDVANQTASADVVLDDGTSIAAAVPVPTLLFLEKQLSDLHTFVTKLPTLDPAERWTFDVAQGVYVTPPTETVKTKKIKRALVLFPATQEHPAQTQLIDEDVIAGTWTTIKHSGAIPDDRRREVLKRIEQLSKAVKEARERANMLECDEKKIADTVFGYLFKD